MRSICKLVHRIAVKSKGGNQCIDLFNNYEITEMYKATIERNSLEVIRDLLFYEDVKYKAAPQGLVVDLVHKRDSTRFTALHVACMNDSMEVVKDLIKSKHINTTS